jgi:fructoselysine-6-phosphate deglycase
MLNFDEDRFRRIQSSAVALADPLHEAVQGLMTEATSLFFLGAGGAGMLMLPAAQLLQRRIRFPTVLTQAAEMVLTDSALLDNRSIVVLPSRSGTTADTIEVMEFVQARGAKVIGLTGHEATPLADGADFNFTNFAEDDTSSESFYLQSLLIALSVMEHQGVLSDRDAIVAELQQLPDLLVEVKRAFEPRAEELADAFSSEGYHIITGSGMTWAEAWYYGTCVLEEMQWIRTRPIHASDFFHGTLELVEEDVSVLVLMGEDEARPLAARVEAFASTVSQKVTILDAAEHELPGISQRVRGMISGVVLATVLERLSAHLEVRRDHPLTRRRYYRRVAY